MTIPSNRETIKKLQELAERNIANGDWGDEVTIIGLPPGEIMPLSPEERLIRLTGKKTLPPNK